MTDLGDEKWWWEVWIVGDKVVHFPIYKSIQYWWESNVADFKKVNSVTEHFENIDGILNQSSIFHTTTKMLVTSGLYAGDNFDVGDRNSIILTSLGCWRPTLMFKERRCCWRKRENRHHHIIIVANRFHHQQPLPTSMYGGYLEMAQKDIEGCNVTWWHIHVILRWLKVRTIQFLFNFCSKYWSRVKILRRLTFFSSKIRRDIEIEAKMIRILSHLRIFELKKVSHLRILTRDQYFEQELKRNWMIRTLSHLKITCICHHVTWYPPYHFYIRNYTENFRDKNAPSKL